MTTLQLGYSNPLTDAFGAHPALGGPLNLNDGAVFTLVSPEGLELPAPPRTLVPAGNIRTQGERAQRAVYRRNREAACRLILGPMASYADLVTTIQTLVAWLSLPPGQPLTIQYQAPGAASPVYLDVVGVAHSIPTDEASWLELEMETVEIVFICRPGLRGDRVTLQNLVMNPGFEQGSGPGVTVFADTFATLNAYTASGGTPTLAANVMTVPAGAQVNFGSPAWGAISQWNVRFKWATGATYNFMLHFVDPSNSLFAQVSGGNLTLSQQVAGTVHQLATVAAALTNGSFYWLICTQYPTVPGDPPLVQATLYNDAGGTLSSQVATLGPTPTFDASTALVGHMAMQAAGAALQVGGAFPSVNQVVLFGPGGWQCTFNGGSGPCSGAWDGARSELGMSGTGAANTYTGGPVSSLGAARLDLPPAGTVNAGWFNYASGQPLAGSMATPVASGGDTVASSAWARSSGLSANASIVLQQQEFNASGALLATHSLVTLNGNQPAWTQLSATLVTQATTAYVNVILTVIDPTSGSAGGTVWFDNVQCWDQTAVGNGGQASMPYCELRFPQSPADLVISGLLGDLPAPSLLSWGTFITSMSPGGSLRYALGRRGQVSGTSKLTAPSVGFFGTLFTPQATAVLDATSYGGFYVKATVSTGGWNPRALSPRSSDALGTFHVMTRYRTQDPTPTGVQVRAKTEQMLDAWYADVNTLKTLGIYFGPFVNPLAAANAWTIADCGQVAIPPYLRGALTDPTQTYVVPRGEWVGTTGGGSEGDASWLCLLPVDGSLVLGIFNDPANNAASNITNQWLWCYHDGLLVNRAAAGDSAAWTYSLETVPIANPGHGGGGPGTQQTGALNVNSGADPYLVLDPTLGLSALSAGLNEAVAYVADQSGAVLPWVCDIGYSPLYLWPR